MQWRRETGTKGMSPNIRDYASAEELVVLINLEDSNADFIRQGLPQKERLKLLREKAHRQLQVLKNEKSTMDGLKNVITKDEVNEQEENINRLKKKAKAGTLMLDE